MRPPIHTPQGKADRGGEEPGVVAEGWGKPGHGQRWHYFRGSLSLCRRVGFYFGRKEMGNDDSPDNCAKCKQLLAAEKAKP